MNFDHAVDIYGSATKNKVFGIYTTGENSMFHAKERVSIETVGGNMKTGNNGILVEKKAKPCLMALCLLRRAVIQELIAGSWFLLAAK